MFRRSVNTSIKLGIVGLILLENVVDGGQEHPCNGNDSFFVTPAFFKVQIPPENFRIAFLANGAQSALDEQRLDVSTGPADIW